MKRIEELERITMMYLRILRRDEQGFLYESLPSIFKPKLSNYDNKVKGVNRIKEVDKRIALLTFSILP